MVFIKKGKSKWCDPASFPDTFVGLVVCENYRPFDGRCPPSSGSSGQNRETRLSHVHVTKISGLTPDDLGEGGGGTLFLKKTGAAGIFADFMRPFGVTCSRHLIPFNNESMYGVMHGHEFKMRKHLFIF
jgi:hypothetical protein